MNEKTLVDLVLKQGPKPSFKLMPFNELVPGTEPPYLVKGLIPRVGLTVVWGPPKCGKSFWTFDLVMHVALGWEFRTRRTKQGLVVYCAFEGADGFKARVEAFRRHYGLSKEQAVDFYLVAARANLITDHPALIEAIVGRVSKNPVVVVLDTLNRSLQGSESKDEDMAAYVKAADAIREKFECAVIIVHHCGVDATRPRGHTSLGGAADAQLAVQRDPAGNIFVEVEWMKDGPEGDSVISKLQTADVGTDSDGDTITSCVVVPVDTPPTKPEATLTKNQTTMFGILHSAGQSGLTTEEWNDRARAAGLGRGRKADLYDFKEALRSKGRVRQYGDRWTVAL
jgi:AAA domain